MPPTAHAHSLTRIQYTPTQIIHTHTPPGKFDAHQDYLSIISNCILEYTLIVGLSDDPCEGGETVIHLTGGGAIASSAPKKLGGCLLFRKDLLHEGVAVTSGSKHILTVPVYAHY